MSPSPATRPEISSGQVPRLSYLRDLALLHLPASRNGIAVACDAVGGLGSKEADTFRTDPRCVGYFAARVVLAEILSIHADPVLLVCTLSVERYPTGEELLLGAQQQLREEELLDRVGVISSAETNFSTNQTSMGVALLGVLPDDRPKGGNVQLGDRLYRLGTPRTGLQLGDADIFPLHHIRTLAACKQITEVIPLGSRGVLGELAQLRTRGIWVGVRNDLTETELSRSAGPANAVLVIANQELQMESVIAGTGKQPGLFVGTVTKIDAQHRQWHQVGVVG